MVGPSTGERPITIALLALGGQGGGVLTKWLVDIAEASGYLAQSTYVAGVAQRTGATVYCVEIFPKARVEELGKEPVFALYPVPGDVDLVIASELAEAGRAVQKGFVTSNLTTLIASSHRVYSIAEKSALGDGLHDAQPIVAGAQAAAKQFICFDMAEAADQTGSVISAVILGSIAGSNALPIERKAYEAAIERSGRAVEANLAGFAAGFAQAQKAGSDEVAESVADPAVRPVVNGVNGQALAERIKREFSSKLSVQVQDMALHGALRVLEYQDRAYADQYLDTLVELQKRDLAEGGEAHNLAVTVAVVPQLALQMCYEDTIRVAELKTRAERFEGIRRDLQAQPDQPAYVVEYFHPRYEEICDTLPARLGERLAGSPTVRRWTKPLFGSGRNINTTKIGGYLMLSTLARLRRWRRGTWRFQIQRERIGQWLDWIDIALSQDYVSAVEIARSIEIVRGYGDTYERGLSRYEKILTTSERFAPDQRASLIRKLHRAALADEQGDAFEQALTQLSEAAS